MRRRQFLLAAVLTFVVAVGMRCLPLLSSPYPFNPDGVLYAGNARYVVATGRLPLGVLQPDALSFPGFVAVLSEVLDVRPVLVTQPVIAIVGAMPVVFGIAVTRRLARRRGMSPGRARTAALLAGVLLAVEGLYLHRSMAADEQTLGLFLVPLALVSVSRVYTGDRRWAVIAVLTLVSLPPLHNLDSVVAALALVVLASYLFVTDRTRTGLAVVVLAVAFWAYLAGFIAIVAALTPAAILQQQRITDVPGLLVAWVVLTSVLYLWWTRLSSQRQRLTALSVGIVWFGLLFVNVFTPVFPGMFTTPVTMFLLLSPLSAVFAAAAAGVPSFATDRPDGVALASVFAGGALLIGLSLTASLTPEYASTIYRSSTFLHFPGLVVAALGVTAVTWRRLPVSQRAVRTTLSVLLVVCAVTSVPVALSGLALLPYKGVTTPAELSASGFATNYTDRWTSDNHLVRIAPYHTRMVDETKTGGSESAAYRWLSGGLPPPCPVLVQRSWTTTGAQFYPAPPAEMAVSEYRRARASRNVVYATTSPDPIWLSVPRNSTCRT